MQTSPLAKAITTTEGILTIVFNAVIAAAAVIPSHGLNPTVAAVVSAASVVALTGQRGLIKAKALQATPLGEKVIEDVSNQLSGQVVEAPIEPPAAPAPAQAAPPPAPVASSVPSTPPPSA